MGGAGVSSNLQQTIGPGSLVLLIYTVKCLAITDDYPLNSAYELE